MNKMYIICDFDGGLFISLISVDNPFHICDRIEKLGVTVEVCKRYGKVVSIIVSNVTTEQLNTIDTIDTLDTIISNFRHEFIIEVDGQSI